MSTNGILSKSKSDAIHCIDQIAANQFDQETLKSLLIALRAAAPVGTWTKEIADFVAHPEKDRGIIAKHLKQFKVDVIPGAKTRIRILLPAPVHANCLVDDLCHVASGVGIDVKPIREHTNDLVLCFFGLLHLATLEFNKVKTHTFKIFHRMYSNRDGVKFLSIIAVNPQWTPAVFNSDIEAKTVLGELELSDTDLNTMLRTVRETHGLRIIRS